MFVVGTVQRHAKDDDATKFDLKWPIVFEDEEQGFVGGQIALRDSRDEADKLATALNDAITANP